MSKVLPSQSHISHQIKPYKGEVGGGKENGRDRASWLREEWERIDGEETTEWSEEA